ncbi:MAG: hypothetical protein ACTSPV_18465, partial [Candidatus Hodarchaeales archaeon]
LSSLFVFAWQEPTTNPPGGNVYAPINTGPSSQMKDGLLGATQFQVQGWDAVYKALDTGDGVNRTFHLIGTYHGWDSEAIYIAGYNYYNPAGGNTANSYAKKVHFGHPKKVTIDLNTGNVTATGQICDVNGCIGDTTTYWTLSGTKLYPNNTGWNVGIGTTNPGSYKLYVNGSLFAGSGSRFNVGEGLVIQNGADLVPENDAREILLDDGNPPTDGSLIFTRRKDSSGNREVILKLNGNNGNVGIGTTGPSEKLHVNGNVRIEAGGGDALLIGNYWKPTITIGGE